MATPLRAGLITQESPFNVKSYGALGNGVTDDTAAIQAAINDAMPNKGRVFLPIGNYIVTGLTIGLNGARFSAEIVGESWQGDIGQANAGGVKVTLAPNSNNSMFTVAPTAAPCRFENLYLDGNRTNQNGTSIGVLFSDYTTDTAKQRSAHFYNVRMESFRTHGVQIGTLRNAGTMDRVVILNCGTSGVGKCLVMGSCNDWRVHRSDFGGAEDVGVHITGGGSSVWTDTNFFTNNLCGVKMDSSSLDAWFEGCSFDTNQQQGVVLVGSTQNSSTSRYNRSFHNCRFNQNSLQTNNTYADIKLQDEPAAVFVGNFFIRGTAAATGGNLPKYHLEIAGTTDRVMWVGNSYQAVSPLSYATAAISDPTKVLQLMGGRINAADLPTSSAGLNSGDLWVDGAAANVVKRV
jgi:hypothetical protein